MKVLSIFGTRPEAVKMAPVVKELSRQRSVESLVCVTAQHREMLDQVVNLFDIHPDFDLNIMQANQTLASLTAEICTRLDPLLAEVDPDWILIQGDTTTVMTAALLAYYRRIRIGHIEAGLRTGDKWQPFPEEINRKIAGVLADLHFAPTAHNQQNLLAEGVDPARIHITGNTIVDALFEVSQRDAPVETHQLLNDIGVIGRARKLVLVTAHRRENFGAPLESICQALLGLVDAFPDAELVYPVHLNPNVQETVYRLLSGRDRIHLLSPQSYRPMVYLMQHASIILTDSGGIQEEATAMQVPALVLREVTERPEGVAAGILRMVGSDPARILAEATRVLADLTPRGGLSRAANPYGDGHAASHIVEVLMKCHAENEEVRSFTPPK